MGNVLYKCVRTPDGCVVTRHAEGGEPEPLDPRLDLWNHSPTGFEFGYGGSGPAQLALALLADATGDDDLAVRLHQALKWTFVADRRTDFSVTAEQVRRWVAENDRRSGNEE